MTANTHLITFFEQSTNHKLLLPRKRGKNSVKGILKHTNDENTLELLFDSLLLQTLSVKTKTNSNTIFNTQHLHDASAAVHIPLEGKFVFVPGPPGQPPDLCTVVRSKRSTVDVLLVRTPLPFETKSFAVDFHSISLLPCTKTALHAGLSCDEYNVLREEQSPILKMDS